MLYRWNRKSDTAGTSRGSSLRTTGMERCVQLLEISKRGGLSSSCIYLTGKVMCQGLTQMSYALDGVGGRRIFLPTCSWTLSATLKVDPSKDAGSARRVQHLVSFHAIIFIRTTHDCYDPLSPPIHLRDGHWFDHVPHQGDSMQGTCR